MWAPEWLQLLGGTERKAWKKLWARSPHERLRLSCTLNAVVAEVFGLSSEDFAWIVRDCDHPTEKVQDPAYARSLDPKGFWRVDKELSPELRLPLLSLVAFTALKDMISQHPGDPSSGIESFFHQNDGEGWMLPETLRLDDYGLGHDERAKKHQPVRERLGPRFYDWQLEQSPEESWKECEKHARNILGEGGFKKLLKEIETQKKGTKAVGAVKRSPPERERPDLFAAAGKRSTKKKGRK